jgi:hypothetical protein
MRHLLLRHGVPNGRRSPPRHRAVVAVAAPVIVIIGSLAGCGVAVRAGSANAVPSGVVTGVAEPCDGPVLNNVDLSTVVTIKAASRTVATQTVQGNHTYRLAVPPGHYTLSSNASPAVAVVVASGHVAHVNLPDLCS